MTLRRNNSRLGSPIVAVFLLVAAMLVVLALSMAAVSRSAADWPAGPLPDGGAGTDITQLVARSTHVG